MKARALTIVWGERHLDWFERALVASLAEAGNARLLQGMLAGWDIVTRQADFQRVLAIAGRLDLRLDLHIEDTSPAPEEILQRELVAQMKRCIASQTSLLLLPPDSLFGDGTIEALFKVGEPERVCVAVPHVRVTPRILEDRCAQSNARLVKAAWANLHRTWTEAETGREADNSFIGGVSWRRIRDGVYAVSHKLPTIYLAKVDASDVEWFENYKTIGAWDHAWPSKVAMEQRQRTIGSSDAAFIAEVTPEFSNIPHCKKADPAEPDKYWSDKAHNFVNRNMVAIFREEGA